MLRFNYDHRGDSAQNTLLFLHGFMGKIGDWDDVLSKLPRDVSTLRVDLPGHGKTSVTGPSSEYGFHSIAGHLVALLESLKIPKVTVVGYSMGGRLGLYLMVHYPELFISGVIVSSSPGLASPEDRRVRCEKDAELALKMAEIPYSEFLSQWYAQPLFTSLRKDARFSELLKRRMTNDSSELVSFLQESGTGRQPSLWEDIHSLGSLVLVTGSLDSKFDSIAREMKKINPKIKHHIIENSGHNIPFERPSELVALLH